MELLSRIVSTWLIQLAFFLLSLHGTMNILIIPFFLVIEGRSPLWPDSTIFLSTPTPPTLFVPGQQTTSNK